MRKLARVSDTCWGTWDWGNNCGGFPAFIFTPYTKSDTPNTSELMMRTRNLLAKLTLEQNISGVYYEQVAKSCVPTSPLLADSFQVAFLLAPSGKQQEMPFTSVRGEVEGRSSTSRTNCSNKRFPFAPLETHKNTRPK